MYPELEVIIAKATAGGGAARKRFYDLFETPSEIDGLLLTGTKKDIGVNPTSSATPLLEGLLLRGKWESHWGEEWSRLYPDRMSLYRSHTRKPSCKIAVSDIQAVSIVEEASPLGIRLFLFRIATAGRVWVFAAPTEASRGQWVAGLRQQVQRLALDRREEGQREGNGSDDGGFDLADARELYLSAPFRWGPPYNRVVLNNRRYQHRNHGT